MKTKHTFMIYNKIIGYNYKIINYKNKKNNFKKYK
jgi:hypothetical protein